MEYIGLIYAKHNVKIKIVDIYIESGQKIFVLMNWKMSVLKINSVKRSIYYGLN